MTRERQQIGWTVRPMMLACLVALFFLTGCGSENPYAISKSILLAVLTAIKRNRGLQFAPDEKLEPGVRRKTPIEQREDREKAWFIFTRTEIIGKRHEAQDWDEEEITPLVVAQLFRIESYLDAKLGPGGLLHSYAEPEGTSPAGNHEAFVSSRTHHLDLANLAIALVDGSSAGLENTYLSARHAAVRSIVWHAAGVHDAVWSNNGDGNVLNEHALNELLDRRLRLVERMRWQVNGDFLPTENPSNNPRGPWLDKSRVRVFEYPYFPRAFVNEADIWRPGLEPRRNHIWIEFGPQQVQYTWIGSIGQMARFAGEPDAESTIWTSTYQGLPHDYTREPGPGPLADRLDELFRSSLNIWDRTWLFCDHSIAAMHLEALSFALARRPQAPSIDTLVDPKQPYLGGIFGGNVLVDNKLVSIDDNRLWSDGVQTGDTDTGGTFDNLLADLRFLQVGDHVILWNHHLYSSVTTGPWRLENSIVFDFDIVTDNWDEEEKDIDPAIFMKPRRELIKLDGFGVDPVANESYKVFREELFKKFKDDFLAVYEQIPSVGNFFVIADSNEKALCVRWKPYLTGIDGGLTDGPWFIFLNRVPRRDRESPYPTVAKMLEVIKHSVINGPDRGTDYQPPPTDILIPGDPRNLRDGVFFPLHLPLVDGRRLMSWDEYFRARAEDSSLTAELRDIMLVPEMVPGLFVRGEDQPMEVVRPRARAS